MKKDRLISLLSKYDIGPKTSNAPNATKWSIRNNTLTVHHLTLQAGCRLVISIPDVELEDCEFGIYDPAKLSKFLQALDSDINVSVRQNTLFLSDSTTSAQYILSPLDIIFSDHYKDPEFDRPFKDIPSPNVEFDLTKEFANKFVKSIGALPEATVFGVTASTMGEQSTIDFTINYSTHQTNHIRISANGQVNSDLDLVAFSASYLQEILSVNSDFTSGKIVIFSKMINDPNKGSRLAAGMDIDFEGDGFSSKYRLQKIEII